MVPPQEHRPEEFVFMQPHIEPDLVVSQETNTRMMSALNWISPSMNFDLTEFDYDPMASSEPYWESPADVHYMPSQAPPETPIDGPAKDQLESNLRTITELHDDAEVLGTAYVDDKGARRPRSGRYAGRIFGGTHPRGTPRHFLELPAMAPEPDGFNFVLLPSPNFSTHEAAEDRRAQPFSLPQYRMMCQNFQDCCLVVNSADHNAPFPTGLPSIYAFTHLLALYRGFFDPKVLPVISLELDSEDVSFWIVKLAMSAIGSQYLETDDMELTVALHEFLRRVLRKYQPTLSTQVLSVESLGLIQAELLNYIGLAYCGSERLERYRMPALQVLINEYSILHKSHSTILRDEMGFENRRDWILSETARRLCHAIWLMESMSRYHFHTQSNLLLDFADIALPCKEDVWQAETSSEQVPVKQPTLERALRVLYVEKRLLSDIGDFARILIIHGLYCQTWDVARFLSRPLLRWTPSAQTGDADSQDLTGPPWLPRVPLYNHWRNAACDCLDVLHWIANSDIAQDGTENPTVLHLHFARIVLLAPYETIREMAELLVSEDVSHGHAAERFQEQCRQIHKWITDDQFKARLALVHCGVFFWHVRRYSADAFYEPVKVFLTTLVVWAYGSLCPPQQPRPSGRNRSRDGEEWSSGSSDVDDISSIRLDRPTDDELVQIFLKRGRSMNATIMGVGNITASNGPLRMLREGCKLLSTLDKWPIRFRYLQILTRLVNVSGAGRPWLRTTSIRKQSRQLASSG